MSKAERFMESLQKQHLVIKAQPAQSALHSSVAQALKQFNLKSVGPGWVGIAENALELQPLRGNAPNLPPPLRAPMPPSDASDGTMLLIFAVPTNVESDSY
jgi:hypothetical protein